MDRAKTNAASEAELTGAINHLAFYADWPRVMSATAAAKDLFNS
ncbi:carboxymuconolactone decarboxylase family protein [[Kitasatospora] papulosa]